MLKFRVAVLVLALVFLSIVQDSSADCGKISDAKLSPADSKKPLATCGGGGSDEMAESNIPSSKGSKEKLKKILVNIDVDKNGKISVKELVDWMEGVMRKYLFDEGLEQMKGTDSNQDKYVTWDELAAREGYVQGDLSEPNKEAEESKQRNKRRFLHADSDKDDKLTPYEYGLMIHPDESTKMSDVVVSEYVEGVDKNKDDLVSLEEYIGEDPDGEPIDKETMESLTESFNELDKNRDAILDQEELRAWLLPTDKTPSQAEADLVMEDLDANKDGFLTEAEIFRNYERFALSRATRFGQLIKEDEKKTDETKTDEKKENEKKEDEKKKDEQKKDEQKEDEKKKDEKKKDEKKEDEKKEDEKKEDEKKEDEKKEDEKKTDEQNKTIRKKAVDEL